MTAIRDMAITEQCELVHEVAIQHGFWDHLMLTGPEFGITNPSIFEEKLALIHSEVSEILDARRSADEAAEAKECADVLIRLMDYCAARNIDLGKEYVANVRENIERPRLHGRVR